MNTETEVLKEDDYIRDFFSDKYSFIPEECKKLKEIENDIMNENNIKNLIASALNIPKGYWIFKLFMKMFDDLNDVKIKLLYENFKDQITDEDRKNVSDITEELKKTSFSNMMADRGYEFVNGKRVLNASKFARHFLQRADLVALNNNDIGIYNKNGYYTRLNADSLVLGKLVHKIMNEVGDRWNSYDEKEGIKAIQRSTDLINNLVLDRNQINLKNGMLDLGNYELKEHSP
ncbi:hypothetical protein GND98_016515 [Clostridium butyricum]|uniref:Uncharacterized protein n=1 Tax=Clostridium butyricum TaxID=1492 RepID=A0A6L9ES57_CLOBU|nr:hypothetical protein [Clostridium butyricum]NAS19412.1 hypothetical protein [Clostridium butyricum]RQN09156.1 hypothetical protein EHW71_12945 [Clostridium butyricum]